MAGTELGIIRQLQHDFPGTEFDYKETFLLVNGSKVRTFLSAEELKGHDPVKPGSRSYYQLFCNIVYNRFRIKPVSGSYADLLIIDEEEARNAAIEEWFAKKRIAFVQDGEEVHAVRYEIDGDHPPRISIEYEEAVPVEPLGPVDTAPEEGDLHQASMRTPEEQKLWEEEIHRLEREGERLKAEMRDAAEKKVDSGKTLFGRLLRRRANREGK